jgi:tetratricopeptide (TPR) repeat protein
MANAPLALATATVMVATRDYSHAADLLVDIIKNAETPLQKNNTAYLLAETGLHLDQAEATERAALDELAAETNSWTLDEAPSKLKQTSSLVSACWDTLGYILFREGRLPEARNYIEAAWHNRQSAEIGLHLGDVLLALHDASGALTTYQLAQTTLPGSTSFRNGKLSVTVSPQSKPIGDKLEAGMAQARAAGAKTQVKDPRVELQKIRVHSLGPAGGRSGSVEYRLLIARDKVEIARPVSVTKLTGADTLFKTATLPGLIPAAPTTPPEPAQQPRIALFGYLNCLSTTCEFIAEP